jgi:hypothetical protein
MAGMPTQDVYRRHSLLKRNARHSREEFSRHYELVHGPLASNQAGFRKYATRYIQNHVEDQPGRYDPVFDGITMTTQAPRADYRIGFFSHPDYANVKSDEAYLLDLGHTVSLIGREETIVDGSKSPHKAIIITARTRMNLAPLKNVLRAEFNSLDTSSATALGFGEGSFAQDLIAELWFADAASREAACRLVAAADPDCIPLLVREVLFFSPEKPWPAAA